MFFFRKEKEPKSESTLVLVVKEVREQLWALSNQVSQVTDKMNDVVETGKAHMSCKSLNTHYWATKNLFM